MFDRIQKWIFPSVINVESRQLFGNDCYVGSSNEVGEPVALGNEFDGGLDDTRISWSEEDLIDCMQSKQPALVAPVRPRDWLPQILQSCSPVSEVVIAMIQVLHHFATETNPV